MPACSIRREPDHFFFPDRPFTAAVQIGSLIRLTSDATGSKRRPLDAASEVELPEFWLEVVLQRMQHGITWNYRAAERPLLAAWDGVVENVHARL